MNASRHSPTTVPGIFPVAATISLLLSIWAAFTAGTINSDGVLYLQSAEMFASGNWAGGYAMYPWPLYSGLVAMLANISGVDFEISAQIVNAALDAITVVSFIAIVRRLGGDRKTVLLSAVVILTLPYLNETRAFVIRDHGYWALYLVSLYCLIGYMNSPGRMTAALWGLSISAATLFRVEGFALAILGAAALALNRYTLRQRFYRMAELLLVPVLLLAITAILVYSLAPSSIDSGSRLLEPLTRLQSFWHGISTGLEDKAAVMRDSVLNRWSDQYATAALLATLAVIFAHRLLITLTPVYLVVLLIPSLRARFKPATPVRRLLKLAVTVQIAVVVVFLVPSFFLSSRFVLPLVLTLLLAAPFALATLHDRYLSNRKNLLIRSGTLLVAVAMTVMALDGLISLSGDRQAHLKQAGHWIQSSIPARARLYTNNHKISYYAGRKITHQAFSRWELTADMARDTDWRRYDYIALWTMDPASPALLEFRKNPGIRERTRFSAPGLDTVVVFQVISPTGKPGSHAP